MAKVFTNDWYTGTYTTTGPADLDAIYINTTAYESKPHIDLEEIRRVRDSMRGTNHRSVHEAIAKEKREKQEYEDAEI
jgi:hypothetical protein